MFLLRRSFGTDEVSSFRRCRYFGRRCYSLSQFLSLLSFSSAYSTALLSPPIYPLLVLAMLARLARCLLGVFHIRLALGETSFAVRRPPVGSLSTSLSFAIFLPPRLFLPLFFLEFGPLANFSLLLSLELMRGSQRTGLTSHLPVSPLGSSKRAVRAICENNSCLTTHLAGHVGRRPRRTQWTVWGDVAYLTTGKAFPSRPLVCTMSRFITHIPCAYESTIFLVTLRIHLCRGGVVSSSIILPPPLSLFNTAASISGSITHWRCVGGACRVRSLQ